MEDNIKNESKIMEQIVKRGGGGEGVKIGRHKIGAWNEMGQKSD